MAIRVAPTIPLRGAPSLQRPSGADAPVGPPSDVSHQGGPPLQRWGSESPGPARAGHHLRSAVILLTCSTLSWPFGCSRQKAAVITAPTSQPSTQPAVVYDTTIARPVPPRDWLERITMQRGADFKLVDKLMDERTKPPPFERKPLSQPAADARITDGVTVLNDTNPFPEPVPLPPKEVTMVAGASISSYHTRTKQEVQSAIAPLLDRIQRDVNVRSSVVLLDTPKEIYFGLIDGKEQMILSNVFDYLLIRSWFANQKNNGVVPLAWSQPANVPAAELSRNVPGVPGTSILLVVARDAPYGRFADLKGTRLALTANYVNAPGAFLTRQLLDIGQPADKPFFSKVTLRRYTKDTVIDVVKGRADVACVDEGTVNALDQFYGIKSNRIRILAVSPRYNLDVLYTSENNVQTHRTEIELTQRQVETLGKDQEGQEVLFFFDTDSWYTYRDGDYEVPEQHFEEFVKFLSQTPVDLKPLLDPKAPVDARTYDRYGDEW